MNGFVDYSQDVEFSKLLQRRADVDLTMLNLELARDCDPEMEFHATLSWIEQRARELTHPVVSARCEREMLEQFSNCLAGTHKIYGDVASYESHESSYLNRLIHRKRGIPISLSLLYMAVAERVGVELHGISTPLHFVLCYQESETPYYIAPFSKGKVMCKQECLEFLEERTQFSPEEMEPFLKPSRPRDIAVRMLNNLKALHFQQSNWKEAWHVQNRLYALEPASYEERRDLGIIAVHAGHPGKAWGLIMSCLEEASPQERQMLRSYLEMAEKELSQYN